MSALIVLLHETPSGASTEYGFAQTRDGMQIENHGFAAVSALPNVGVSADVVALVPGRWLSWHAVDLPKGSLAGGATRLRAVLEGLLEDRLLDDPAALHFALDTHRESHTVWVAACDKAKLQAALAPLEAAGRPVSRIVPEFSPLRASPEQALRRWYVSGAADQAWLTDVGTQGVTTLPWSALAGDHPTDVQVYAEPAVTGLASQVFGTAVQLQQAPERWLQAVQASDWDLAQFDLANSGGRRAWKKIGDTLSNLANAPRWRAARWGLGVAVAAHLVGLNAWAWKTQTAVRQQRTDVQSVLTTTFPHVKVVIDAPVQMTRELAMLRQNAGAPSAQDLENLLSAVGRAVPNTAAIDFTALNYADGELTLKGVGLQGEPAEAVATALRGAGLAVKLAQDSLSVQPATRPGLQP